MHPVATWSFAQSGAPGAHSLPLVHAGRAQFPALGPLARRGLVLDALPYFAGAMAIAVAWILALQRVDADVIDTLTGVGVGTLTLSFLVSFQVTLAFSTASSVYRASGIAFYSVIAYIPQLASVLASDTGRYIASREGEALRALVLAYPQSILLSLDGDVDVRAIGGLDAATRNEVARLNGADPVLAITSVLRTRVERLAAERRLDTRTAERAFGVADSILSANTRMRVESYLSTPWLSWVLTIVLVCIYVLVFPLSIINLGWWLLLPHAFVSGLLLLVLFATRYIEEPLRSRRYVRHMPVAAWARDARASARSIMAGAAVPT